MNHDLMCTEQKRLIDRYQAIMPALRAHALANPDLSKNASLPFLINLSATRFLTAKPKLLVVGQATYGWGWNRKGSERIFEWSEGSDSILSHALNEYHPAEMLRGNSPFWTATKELVEQLGLQCDEFAWSNLCRLDMRQINPGSTSRVKVKYAPAAPLSPELQEKLSTLIVQEMEILKPDLVVFFTGHELKASALASPVRFDKLSSAALWQPVRFVDGRPCHAVVSYHPAYLQRKKELKRTLNEMIPCLRESWAR